VIPSKVMVTRVIKVIDPKKEDLNGVYGWLIIPFFGLLFSSFFTLIYIAIFILTIITEKTFYFFQIGSVMFILLGIFSIYLFVLLIKQSKKFPKLMTSFLIISLILNSLSTLAMGRFISFIFSLAISIIWMIYFKVSKRVKKTFIY